MRRQRAGDGRDRKIAVSPANPFLAPAFFLGIPLTPLRFRLGLFAIPAADAPDVQQSQSFIPRPHCKRAGDALAVRP